ncbi:MAG: ATP-binding protein [Pseudomonadota bacterium]
MNTKIGRSVFLNTLAVSLTILIFSAVLTRWYLQRGFFDYVAEQEAQAIGRTVAELADIFERDGNWDALRENPRRWFEVFERADGPWRSAPPRPNRLGDGPRDRRPRDGRRRPPGGGQPPPHDGLGAGHVSLLDKDGVIVIEAVRQTNEVRQVPVLLNGETIAYLDIYARKTLSNPSDLAFVNQQERVILISALAALLLAAIVSAFFARRITRPIASLVGSANALAKGALETRSVVNRADELGELSASFNHMASRLEKSRDARRRWVADIAHELRTPLAVLRGEIDAVEDGVRTFNDKMRESLQAEILRLSNLVDDLHQLSVYDEGSIQVTLSTFDLSATLVASLETANPRFEDLGLTIEREIPSGLKVRGDKGRLQRVFSNLLENALRYTDSPGRLVVTAQRSEGDVLIEFEDSAPGVTSDSLDHLFERLYRADQSRSREFGGSGLGLSICKAIVESHDGTIHAEHGRLGGLKVSVRLPASE